MKEKLPPIKIPSEGKLTNIEGKLVKFKIGKYVTLFQSTYKRKFFILEEILFEKGKKEIRIGYYMIGEKPKMKGKWVWGQFCPLIPKKDLERLLDKARKKGII